MRHFRWQILSLLLVSLLLSPSLSWGQGPQSLSVVVVTGEGAIHNIIRQVVVEPIVEVRDEQGRPVAGATVLFSSPESGPSVSFLDGSRRMTVRTDESGRARARGMVPNIQEGAYMIEVTATMAGLRANGSIAQTNAVPAQTAAKKKPFAWKLLAGVAAAAAAGVVVAVQKSDKTGPAQSTSLTLGSIQVGPPR